MDINELIKTAKEKRASDIHLSFGLPIRLRIDGQLQDLDDSLLTEDDCKEYARQLCGEQISVLDDKGEVDLARTFDGNIRCRINVYKQKGYLSSAVRILSAKIPDFKDLDLPEVIETFSSFPKGIVLVTGETGSGKSTTLAAIIDRINHTRREHIITLEEPVEYVYKSDLCSIDQREIGKDTASYSGGLRAALREDPDIILVGEMRDADTIETVLTAAETGHLVFGTLHTAGAASTIDRIVNAFPSDKQQQVRLQLSQSLMAVVTQKLLPKAKGEGRIVACEVMKPNHGIRSQIREGKTEQINSSIATTVQEGNISFDMYLVKLVREGKINAQTAFKVCNEYQFLEKQIGGRLSTSTDRMVHFE